MEKFLLEISNKLAELYKIYEIFIWKNEKYRKLAIVFQDNMIMTFYLYEQDELLDEFHLAFDSRERDLFYAICLRTFVNILGNVMVYNNKNVYYNNTHKPYLALIVKDDYLKKQIDNIIVNQSNEKIDYDIPIVKSASYKVKNRRYPKEFLKKLDMRIHLSYEMLKRW